MWVLKLKVPKLGILLIILASMSPWTSWWIEASILLMLTNPIVPNAPFLYPLKASKNRKVFRCF